MELASERNVAEVSYIKANVTYKYYTTEHLKYLLVLIIPMLIFFILIGPASVLLRLYLKRESIVIYYIIYH